MRHTPLICFRVRFGLTVLLCGLMLTLGLFGLGGQHLSWAAPAQNPHLQTIPTRPPDEEPPPPPAAGPPAEAPAAPADNGNNDTSPTQTDHASQDEPQPDQPSIQTDNGDQDEAQLAPIPNQESDQNKTQAPPAQPSQKGNQADGSSASLLQADLSLSQTVSNPTPYLGEVITFTTVISNQGPGSATDVVVSSPLPPGLTLSSTLASQGQYRSDLELWGVGIITPSQSVTLSLVVTVTNAGAVTNTTEITAAHPADPDSIPGNGLEYEDDWASVPIVALPATSSSFQSDSDSIIVVPASMSASGSFSELVGSLSWLYILGLGVVLILSGMYLVNRA
ncbi:MAG TPA: DUF11 domain-containing protein [Anaerolineae bacterium]|nr:DUF11 domain-containing protein [Anaerolineae bacterium]